MVETTQGTIDRANSDSSTRECGVDKRRISVGSSKGDNQIIHNLVFEDREKVGGRLDVVTGGIGEESARVNKVTGIRSVEISSGIRKSGRGGEGDVEVNNREERGRGSRHDDVGN